MPFELERWPGSLEWEIDKYLKTHTVKEAAEHFGIGFRRLKHYLWKNEWSPKRGGITLAEAARLLGVNKHTLRYVMRGSGIHFTYTHGEGKRGKSYFSMTDSEFDQLTEYVESIRRAKSMMSMREAQRRLGICWHAMQRLIKKTGVEFEKVRGVNGLRLSDENYQKLEQELIRELAA